jgi:hypothetical protein
MSTHQPNFPNSCFQPYLLSAPKLPAYTILPETACSWPGAGPAETEQTGWVKSRILPARTQTSLLRIRHTPSTRTTTSRVPSTTMNPVVIYIATDECSAARTFILGSTDTGSRTAVYHQQAISAMRIWYLADIDYDARSA